VEARSAGSEPRSFVKILDMLVSFYPEIDLQNPKTR